MSFLKRKPDRELGHLTRKRDQLEARLADARTALDRAHEARNRALLEGDLDDSLIGEHNSRCRSADDHIIGIEHALDELQHKIDQVDVAADRARVEREAASGEMLAQVALVRDAVAQFRTSAAHLVEALRPMASLPAAGVFLSHVSLTLQEMPSAIEREIVAVAEARAAEILSGHVPPVHHVPVAAEPELIPQEQAQVDRRSLILFQNSKWSENGAVRYAQKYAIVELPAQVVASATSRNLGDDPNSLRGVNVRNGFGASHGTVQLRAERRLPGRGARDQRRWPRRERRAGRDHRPASRGLRRRTASMNMSSDVRRSLCVIASDVPRLRSGAARFEACRHPGPTRVKGLARVGPQNSFGWSAARPRRGSPIGQAESLVTFRPGHPNVEMMTCC
jgi:hypothetical protein